MHSLNNEEIRKMIMKNYNNPNKKGVIKSENVKIRKKNLLACNDDIEVNVLLKNSKIEDAMFNGVGCAIATASSNVFCNQIVNKTIEEVKEIYINYEKMLKKESYNKNILGDLILFEVVSKQPNRIKCATITSNLIKEIIEGEKDE